MQRRQALQSLIGAMAGGSIGTAVHGHGVQTQRPATLARQRTPQFATADDGTRLFVRSSGAGRPVLFVAPWGLNADWWEYQTTALAAESLRCVSFDRRGHGRSDEPDGGCDFDVLAADIGVVIRQLDLRDVMLVGHSLGSAESVRYLARQNDGHVTRAVLVAPITPFLLKTADNPNGVDGSVFQRARELFKKDRARRIAEGAPGFFGVRGNPVSSEIIDWWTRMMVDRCSMNVMLDLHVLMTETDFRSDLPQITVPTLVVHGDSDTSAPLGLTGRATHQLIPGSRLEIYNGAAHGLPFTHMDRLAADLLAFARGLG